MKAVIKISLLVLGLHSAACAPLGDIGSGGGDAKVFSVTECPALAGSYNSENRQQMISETRTSSSYKVVLGEGAHELQIDGVAHTEGPLTYQGLCTKGVLELAVSAQGENALIRYYFNNQGQLVEETWLNGQFEKRIWVRK